MPYSKLRLNFDLNMNKDIKLLTKVMLGVFIIITVVHLSYGFGKDLYHILNH